jgi:hypothetical protein
MQTPFQKNLMNLAVASACAVLALPAYAQRSRS